MTPAGVRAWQRIWGLYGHDVDGNVGPKTIAAFRAWCGLKGIAYDGIVGPACREAIGRADLINAFEGCVLQAYDDAPRKGPGSALKDRLLHRVGGMWFRADSTPESPKPCIGVATIGWGSTEPCRRGIERCTRAEADAWRDVDLEHTRGPAVRRYAALDWDPACLAAVYSFCYNEGVGALTMLAASKFAPDHWILWDKSGGAHDIGLHGRREEEIALCYERDPWTISDSIQPNG